jgi:hypothetical protein
MVQNKYSRFVKGKWICEGYAQSHGKTLRVVAKAKTKEKAESIVSRKLGKKIVKAERKWLDAYEKKLRRKQ